VPAGSQTRGTANWGGGQRSASWGAGLRSVYSGPNWTLGKSLGDTSGVPSGFGGRWFGSHFGAVTSNAPSGYQQWWAQNVFGNAALAGRIGDTDFGATDQRAGHVYELPGSTKRKWTFVRYLPDPSNPGQDIAVWRDPMGTIQAFNHTDPRGLRTSYGGWRQLRPGMVGYGGQAAGVSMESHVCIVTSPDGRQDLMILTGQGEMQMRAAGKKVQPLAGCRCRCGARLCACYSLGTLERRTLDEHGKAESRSYWRAASDSEPGVVGRHESSGRRKRDAGHTDSRAADRLYRTLRDQSAGIGAGWSGLLLLPPTWPSAW
jgi:hypothetical protein